MGCDNVHTMDIPEIYFIRKVSKEQFLWISNDFLEGLHEGISTSFLELQSQPIYFMDAWVIKNLSYVKMLVHHPIDSQPFINLIPGNSAGSLLWDGEFTWPELRGFSVTSNVRGSNRSLNLNHLVPSGKLTWHWKMDRDWRCIPLLKMWDFPAIAMSVYWRVNELLVGGFNPFEKYDRQNGFIFPNFHQFSGWTWKNTNKNTT